MGWRNEKDLLVKEMATLRAKIVAKNERIAELAVGLANAASLIRDLEEEIVNLVKEEK